MRYAAYKATTFSPVSGVNVRLATANPIGIPPADSRRVHIAYNTTHINDSGPQVKLLLERMNNPSNRLLVIADEVDTEPPGFVLTAASANPAHRGLASVAASILSRDFNVLKIGIGRPLGCSLREYVTQPFSSDQYEAVCGQLGDIMATIDDWTLRILA